MGNVPMGKGRTSRHYLASHPFKGSGLWWRSEEDYLAFKQEYNEKRRVRSIEIANGSPKRRPGNPKAAGAGASSMKWRPTHQFKKRGRYWKSEEHYKIFAESQALKKRADRNEVSVEHQLEIERQTQAAIQAAMNREDHLTREFQRLKEKHGLRKLATRVELKNVYAKTLDPEIKQFFHLESIAQMKADEKLKEIRELFLSGARPQDILYRTALMVGVTLRKAA